MKKHVILFLILNLFISKSAISQHVDYNKFIKETQKSSTESGEISIAWWIPKEFWEITFNREKTMTEKQIDEFIKLLSPYVIFAVVDGKIGSFGGVTYTSVDSIANSIELIDNEGKIYRPLETYDLSPDIQNLLSAFKPILKNMMGQLGENMNFFVFKDIKDKDKRVADPLSNGFIHLNFCKKENKWKVPIGSLLPLKKCPFDNELMDGSWNYCPWHGEKLVK